MLLIFAILVAIVVVVPCVMAFLIVKVWNDPKVSSSTNTGFGAIGPPGPNQGPGSAGENAGGSSDGGGSGGEG